MELFQPAKPLFSHDLETNYFLKLNRDLQKSSLGVSLNDSRLLRSFLRLIFAVPLYFLNKKPKFRFWVLQKIKKYKKFVPVFLKKSLRVIFNFIQSNFQIPWQGLYEMNITHPKVLIRGFGLPTSTTPEVSIIIPVFNHIDATLKLLHKLRLNSDVTKYEIIIVDDASTDSTKEYLSNIRGINIVTLSANVGYLKATNLGIKYSRGDYLCLLNNDTEPENGWLDALFRTIKNDPQIAIAGSMLVNIEGNILEAGGQIFANREVWNLGRGSTRQNEIYNFTREVDYCSAAAILVDGLFLRNLNGFDERFAPAYYEDTDLATTAWSVGRKVVYVHDSVVHHIEGLSHGKNVSKGLKQYQATNKQKYWDKWEQKIVLPWKIDEFPRLEADRESRGIIVFIDKFIPSLNSNAGATRAYRIIEAMRQLKFHVVVIPEIEGVEILNREQLRRNGVEVYQSYDAAVSSLKSRSERIHSFWVSRFDTYEFFRRRLMIDFPDARLIFDTVDLHYLREERNIALKGQSAAIYGANAKARELALCQQATKVVVVAEYEKNILLSEIQNLNVDILFMPQSTDTKELRSKSSNYFLFVGNFVHSPNVDGVEWLIDEILPMVIEMGIGQFEVRIVGEGLPKSILDKINPEFVTYLGWQEDLEEIYLGARFVIMPLRYGAGLKGKLSEAAIRKCPVISTSIGAEGYVLEPERDYLLADSAEDFAKAIVNLWTNPELATSIAASAKLQLQVEFSLEVFSEKVADILTFDQE